MPKTEAPGDVRGANEIQTQQLVQSLDRRRLGNGSGSRGQLGLEGIARHRRPLEDEARLVGEQAELLRERRHDALWDLRSGEVTSARVSNPCRAVERPRELLEVERIAAALLVEPAASAPSARAHELPASRGSASPSSMRCERACSMGALERGAEPFGQLPRPHGHAQASTGAAGGR